MMEVKKDKKKDDDSRGTLTGVCLTVAVHAVALIFVSFTGLKYIYPPPSEKTMLIDFSEEMEVPVQRYDGNAPKAENPDRTAPVNLVRKSESAQVAQRQNLTPQTKPDDFGDVPADTPALPEEPKLDPRAAFPGMAKKDTTLSAGHAADRSSNKYTAGQSDGNTKEGRTDGRPNAHLKGRNTVGNVPRPVYDVQESGIVVVDIWVDNYGTVVKAVPGGDGTTVLNKALHAAARNAAMQTHFNMSTDAPAMQEGKITYTFNLK